MQNETAKIILTEETKNDPIIFFEKILGVTTLEDYQKKVLLQIAENERVSIAAAHDLGKSFLMARTVIWYLTCFPYSKVITTAPTYNQVKNILWSEIRSAYSRAKFPLGGKLNLTDWSITEEGDWFAIGFTPKNEVTGGYGQGTQSSFQGFHAPFIMVVFDEATGVPNGVWTMAEGLLTSGQVKFVTIGNPTSRNSEFFNCFRSPAWTKVKLSCFDSPNLIANGITDQKSLDAELDKIKSMSDKEAQEHLRKYKEPKPYLLVTKWVIANLLKWGISHPLSVSKIFGQFPEEGDNALFPLGRVEEAQLRIAYPTETDRKTIGVDVARFGVDCSVITAMHGPKVLKKKVLTKRDTNEVSGEVIAMGRELWPDNSPDIIIVDETGLGGGVVDVLREKYKSDRFKPDVRGVQFGASCEKDEDKERYSNMKARIYGLLADDIKREDGIALLPEAIYVEEMPTILYAYDSKGRMVIESKDEYKKRTGRNSPDTTDSLALANFGRYDQANVGIMSSNFFKNLSSTRAGSLGANRSW